MKRICMSFVLTSCALFMGNLVQAQQRRTFSPDAQKTARDVLNSPFSVYLSGTGRRALEIMSGAPIVGKGPSPGTSLDSANVGVSGKPAQADLGEVMVNNPDQDLRTAEDISTQSETALAGFNRTVVVAFNDSGQASDNPSAPFSLMGYSRSLDGGATFTDIGNIPAPQLGANFGDPGMTVDTAGTFYASAIVFAPDGTSGGQQTVGVYKSTDGGLTWPVLAVPPPASWATVSAADKPFITVDTSKSQYNGRVYISWTSFAPPPPFGPPGLPVVFARSTDGGLTFSPPIIISAPGDVNQGSEPVVGPNGEIYVTWLRLEPAPQLVMMARSLDGGQTFTPPVAIAPVTNIGFASGTLNGAIRVLSWPRVDVSPTNGNIYVVYASNPPGPDGADVYITMSADRGQSWSVPLRINDDTTQHDQFFPDVAVNSQGAVQVIWYDRRNDPQNRLIDVYRARVGPNGRSVQPNQKVTSVSFPPAVAYDPVISPTYMGDYIDLKSLFTPEGKTVNFAAAWGDNRRSIVTAGGRRNDQDVFFTKF